MTHSLRDWLPPAAGALIRAFKPGSNHFTGPETSWESAAEKTAGYGSKRLIENLADAARSARARDGVDRDGIVLVRPSPPWSLLALLNDAWRRSGKLHVLDVGGGLGNSFRACKRYLPKEAQWTVVEQPALHAIGEAEFSGEGLRFAESVHAVRDRPPNVILLSSVLQYLPDPEGMLATLARLPATYLIVERTPMTERNEHLPATQRAPAALHGASYPLWLLSRPRLCAQLDGWRNIETRRSAEGIAFTRSFFRFEFLDMSFGRVDIA